MKLALLLVVVALASWGVRELFPKTDETESKRLQVELKVAQDSSRARGERADAKADTLEATRLAFEADTVAHVEATQVAVESAESIAARLRPELRAEHQVQLDSVIAQYETALAESEAGRISNSERLRETETALLFMTESRDSERQTVVIAELLATENWNLYQAEKRRSLFNIFDFQCTVGATAIYGTKGPDVGGGITCGLGR